MVLAASYGTIPSVISAPRTFNLQNVFFRASRLSCLPLLALFFIVACAPTAAPTAAPTRRPTRELSLILPPTKVARIAPTDTPVPTRTPRPTRTPVPTDEPTDAPTNTPVKRSTRAATPVSAAAGTLNNVPATAPPTVTPSATDTPTITAAPPNPGELTSNLATNAPCDVNGGGDYGTLGAGGWEGRDPATHPDLNLAVRGYKVVNELRQLVDYDGNTDGDAPQLWGLFADRRTPVIAHTFQVYDWDWGSNSRGDLISDYPATMVGLQTAEGETIFTPDFGHEIGDGYVALVLYADPHRVTIKYTGEDNVIDGYTLHLEGICVYSNLLNLYNQRQAAGRGSLPALRPGQPIGYMPGIELGVAIRDRGAFLDPRSRKDWWQGR